jgi:hypothetical protein
VDSSKIRDFKGAICQNIDDVIIFYDKILQSCPEFLNLPAKLIHSENSKLNGILLSSHPDLSEIFWPMMKKLCELYLQIYYMFLTNFCDIINEELRELYLM